MVKNIKGLKRLDPTELGLGEGRKAELNKNGTESCLCLEFWYFVHCGLVLIFKKYCIKIASCLLGLGASLKFCAQSECLALLILFLGLEQHWWDHHLMNFRPLICTQTTGGSNSHLEFAQLTLLSHGHHVYHRTVAWTKRKGNRPRFCQGIKPGKFWFSTGLLYLDLICH